MKARSALLLVALFFCGCATSFQGYRMRATAPGMDEAFRKIGIAADLDGYTRTTSDPVEWSFQTDWRAIKKEERSGGKSAGSGDDEQVRLTVKLALRGRMYDVFLGIFLRSGETGSAEERPAPVDHPVVMKWRKILNSLLVREARDED